MSYYVDVVSLSPNSCESPPTLQSSPEKPHQERELTGKPPSDAKSSSFGDEREANTTGIYLGCDFVHGIAQEEVIVGWQPREIDEELHLVEEDKKDTTTVVHSEKKERPEVNHAAVEIEPSPTALGTIPIAEAERRLRPVKVSIVPYNSTAKKRSV